MPKESIEIFFNMLRILPLTLLLVIAGCSAAPVGQTVHDPYEGANRQVHTFNKNVNAALSGDDDGEALSSRGDDAEASGGDNDDGPHSATVAAARGGGLGRRERRVRREPGGGGRAALATDADLHAFFAEHDYHLVHSLYGSPFSDFMGVAVAWPRCAAARSLSGRACRPAIISTKMRSVSRRVSTVYVGPSRSTSISTC